MPFLPFPLALFIIFGQLFAVSIGISGVMVRAQIGPFLRAGVLVRSSQSVLIKKGNMSSFFHFMTVLTHS